MLVYLTASWTDLTQFVTRYPVLFTLLHWSFPLNHYRRDKLHIACKTNRTPVKNSLYSLHWITHTSFWSLSLPFTYVTIHCKYSFLINLTLCNANWNSICYQKQLNLVLYLSLLHFTCQHPMPRLSPPSLSMLPPSSLSYLDKIGNSCGTFRLSGRSGEYLLLSLCFCCCKNWNAKCVGG